MPPALRLSLVCGAVFDVVMLGVLVLQQIGFPEELDAEVGLALSMEMFGSPWFQYAAGASAFPLLGAVGAICLWRWALWLYCIFLVACIGVCSAHKAARAKTRPSRRACIAQASGRTLCSSPASRRASSRATPCCETWCCSPPPSSCKSGSSAPPRAWPWLRLDRAATTPRADGGAPSPAERQALEARGCRHIDAFRQVGP